MAEFSSLVFVLPEMDSQADFQKPLSKLQVRRRGESRVAAQDHEYIDPASLDIGNQLTQGLELIDRVGLEGRRVVDGLAHVPERFIHGVRQRVHDRQLLIARHHQTRPAVLLKITDERGDPIGRKIGKLWRRP